jgi:hypothetical protein
MLLMEAEKEVEWCEGVGTLTRVSYQVCKEVTKKDGIG